MRGVTERIHDGREVIGYLRVHVNDVGFRYRDELCKTTVASHDTERDGVLAHVSHASAAVTAMSACDMSFGRHAVAYLEIAHTGSAVRYDAHELMSHGVRRFAVGLRPRVPFVHMQIRTADSSLGHLDDHIIDPHFGHRHIFHPDAGFGISLNKRFHFVKLLNC